MSLTPQLTRRLRTILRMYWLSSTTRIASDWILSSICFLVKFEVMTALDEHEIGQRRIGFRLVARQFARFGAVIIALLHHLTRSGEDGEKSREQRGRRHRLDQEFVDAEADRLDHPRTFAMGGEHDDRHVGIREATRR